MRWEAIHNLSCYSTINVIKEADVSRSYKRIRMLEAVPSSLSQNELYFCRASILCAFPDLAGISAVVLAEGTGREKMPAELLCNCIACPDEKAFFSCFTMVDSLFDTEHEMLDAINRLYQMVASNKGLQNIVNLIAEIFQNPISVIDNSYTYLAASENYVPTSQDLIEERELGYLSTRVLNNLRSQGFFSAGRSRTAPTVLELGGMCNHFTNILINDIEIGSFSVFELLSPIPAEKIEYLPQIACVLSLEMQKSSFYQTNKATHYTHLFSLLLSGERLNTQDIEARLQLFNYRLRSEKYVVYIDAENLICAGAQLQFLADRIHRTFTNSIYTVKANAIIFLITRDPIDDISNEELSDWNSFMRANSMYAGMSSRFTDLSSVTFRLEEAKRALLIGRMFASSHCFYCFDQYRLGNMIHDLNQQAKLSFYLYPPLMRLIRHEKGKDTQLVYTLYEYLKQTKNPTAVCEKLFIHKNTLFYRLDKIRSIMGIRFESADEITQIQISFTILQYQKALPWPQTETD